MSKSQAIAFFEEISKNNKLAQEVEKVVGGKNSDEAKAKELLSLAKDHGFNFTKEEAARAQGALKTSLSPEDMLEVSGGKLNLKSSVMAMALLTGLGVGGATLSNMEANAMKPNKSSPTDQATLSAFRSAHPLSFTVYDGYEPRQRGQGNADDDDSATVTDEEVRRMEEEAHRVDDENNSEAIYPGQQTRQQNTQPNQQGLGLTFNPSFVGQPGSEHTQKEKLREKLSRKQEMKQQREQEENSHPKLPADRAEQRNGAEQVRERRAHRDAGWMIHSSLTSSVQDVLVQKYRTLASLESDIGWIVSVARAVANGVRPNLNLQLTNDSHGDFRELCAYCGRSGCVEISEPDKYGWSTLHCTHDNCPLNWVVDMRRRQVSEVATSLKPLDYEIQRWALLPQLIAEIENLVARTEYNNYGNAVRLHDSADAARQATELWKQNVQEAERLLAEWWQSQAEDRLRQEARRQAELRRHLLKKVLSNPLSLDKQTELVRAVAKTGLIHCSNLNIDTNKICNSTNVYVHANGKTTCYFRCNDCFKRNKATMGTKGTTFTVSHKELMEVIEKEVKQTGSRPPMEEVENVEQHEPSMQMMQQNSRYFTALDGPK